MVTSHLIESARDCANQIVDQWSIHSLGKEYSWYGFDKKSIGASERFEFNEILSDLISKIDKLTDNLSDSSIAMKVPLPLTREEAEGLMKHFKIFNQIAEINDLVFTKNGYNNLKETFDKLQKMHQTINELNSKSPLLITSSHLGLENEKILSLQSSLDYVLDLPFIGADSLVSVELMNTLLIETNTINQAFEKLNIECLRKTIMV